MPLRRSLLEMPTDGEPPKPEVVEHKWNLFLELMRLAEAGSCRHDAILRYFGDEEETLAGCGICDVCTRLDSEEDGQDPELVALIVRKALSAVARVSGRFGLGAAVKLLRGEDDDRLTRTGLDRTPTFGALREHPEQWLSALTRRFVTAGWVDFEGAERPVALLTETGRKVMRGELPARLVLPARRPARAAARPGPRRAAPAAAAELDGPGRAVFEALRRHRLEVARAERVPPYVVASDRTLREIAMLRPRNRDELLLAHGIGPAKAERYGPGLLDAVARAGLDA
jgi:ATP-dependent DNA helicase RecQ